MAYAKIRIRRDTAAGWALHNPILSEGEVAFEVPNAGAGSGLINIKQGDGVTAWNDLPYGLKTTELVEVVSTMQTTLDDMELTMSDFIANGGNNICYNTEENPPEFGNKDFLWLSTKTS